MVDRPALFAHHHNHQGEKRMPRKPKMEKQTITVVVNHLPVTVILHPPTGLRKSWYAYWTGLVASKSTSQRKLEDAIVVVEKMVNRWIAGGTGSAPTTDDLVMTDEEFKALQQAHYNRRKDPDAARRAAKTSKDCLESIEAFKAITGLDRVAAATPHDCGRFQQEALTRAKNWRHTHAREGCAERVSPNTVLKWSRTLAAAFERANRNAGKKCIRGVLAEEKLLESNPWNRFAWLIEGIRRPVVQFNPAELLSLLTFVETKWGGIQAGAAAFKTLLWSGIRREELATLSWDALRVVDGEHHFEVVGKHGVRRWLRLPDGLYHELVAMRTENAFVFAAYTGQLQRFHADEPNFTQNIRAEFKPANFEQWLYRRVKDWAAENGKGNAYVHTFRKTGLQHARDGEDINREVAADARVSPSVLTGHYVTQSDAQLRAGSNRTFRRILASLPADVARRYGHGETNFAGLEKQLKQAVKQKNWDLARELSARLALKDRATAS
jgi:integrase